MWCSWSGVGQFGRLPRLWNAHTLSRKIGKQGEIEREVEKKKSSSSLRAGVFTGKNSLSWPFTGHCGTWAKRKVRISIMFFICDSTKGRFWWVSRLISMILACLNILHAGGKKLKKTKYSPHRVKGERSGGFLYRCSISHWVVRYYLSR